MDLTEFYERLDAGKKQDLEQIVAPLKELGLDVLLVNASENNDFTNVHLETIGNPSFSKSRLLLAIVQITQQGARIHSESADSVQRPSNNLEPYHVNTFKPSTGFK